MVKSFLRYGQDGTLGVISSGNVVFDKLNKRAVVCALENIIVWNLKKGEIEFMLTEPELENKPRTVRVSLSPNGRVLAAGYADGTVRLWDVTERLVTVTLSGHRTEVTSLDFNHDGSQLASGSKENEIVVWDVAGERGLFRLRGHTGAITDLCFLKGTSYIASSAKDGFVKIWDTITQHCVQTLVGHRGEVLSVVQSRNRLVTSASDSRIIIWEIICKDEMVSMQKQTELEEKDKLKKKKAKEEHLSIEKPGLKRHIEESNKTTNADDEDDEKVVRLLGEINCEEHSTSSLGRNASQLTVSADETILSFAVGEKTIVFYKIASEEDIIKKQKRREKRLREKLQKKAKTDSQVEKINQEDNVVNDEFTFTTILRLPSKLRGFALSSHSTLISSKQPILHVLVSSNENSVVEYFLPSDNKEEEEARKISGLVSGSTIALQGHRSDVRAITTSPNCSFLASIDSTQLKVWSLRVGGGTCISTHESKYGLCVLFCPGNRHILVGTKFGMIEVHELSSGRLIETLKAHNGSIWSLSLSADSTTVLSASSDKTVKCWSFDFVSDPEYSNLTKRLTLVCTQTITMEEDVLFAKFSPKGKYIVISLLDCTIKVYKTKDTKFYLSLYGHKLPVLTLDVCDDETLLISGSADKNVKIWGLDFGDCHRSLFAHDNTVTQVVFQPKTHYFFSAGKDGIIKQWDADKFDCIQILSGHHGHVWALCISFDGTVLFSASQDRSIRIWKRTDDQIFLEEEREKILETTFDKTLIEHEEFVERNDPNAKESEIGSKKTLESIKSAERLVESLELCSNEQMKRKLYEEEAKIDGGIIPFEENILLLGKTPSEYLLERLIALPPSHLDQALLLIPFTLLPQFIEFCIEWVKKGKRVELVSDCVFFLFRVHQTRLGFSTQLHKLVLEAREVINAQIQAKKEMLGFNLAGLQFLRDQIESDTNVSFYTEANKILNDLKERELQKPKRVKKNKKQPF